MVLPIALRLWHPDSSCSSESSFHDPCVGGSDAAFEVPLTSNVSHLTSFLGKAKTKDAMGDRIKAENATAMEKVSSKLGENSDGSIKTRVDPSSAVLAYTANKIYGELGVNMPNIKAVIGQSEVLLRKTRNVLRYREHLAKLEAEEGVATLPTAGGSAAPLVGPCIPRTDALASEVIAPQGQVPAGAAGASATLETQTETSGGTAAAAAAAPGSAENEATGPGGEASATVTAKEQSVPALLGLLTWSAPAQASCREPDDPDEDDGGEQHATSSRESDVSCSSLPLPICSPYISNGSESLSDPFMHSVAEPHSFPLSSLCHAAAPQRRQKATALRHSDFLIACH
mmetsp:Transcript_16519/g.25038  ORF Transcript_16519/g.25038 Transcript_16519/m.25038 type:complete len:343 (+) Transcript_16519:43-1071(+)